MLLLRKSSPTARSAILLLLCMCVAALAMPFPWQSHHVGYDASLDPIVWSRAFVKDAVRRPRQFGAPNALLADSLAAEEGALPSRHHKFTQAAADASSQDGGFGKRMRRPTSLWHDRRSATVDAYGRAGLRKYLKLKRKFVEHDLYG